MSLEIKQDLDRKLLFVTQKQYWEKAAKRFAEYYPRGLQDRRIPLTPAEAGRSRLRGRKAAVSRRRGRRAGGRRGHAPENVEAVHSEISKALQKRIPDASAEISKAWTTTANRIAAVTCTANKVAESGRQAERSC